MSDEIAEDWDFKGVDTKYSTHGIHYYPARMIPQIARRLICRYTQKNDLILDPFCGSGTVLLESKLLHRHAIGFDINPLAILLSNVKTSGIDEDEVRTMKKILINIRDNNGVNVMRRHFPDFKNLNYWFTEKTIKELLIIKHHILNSKISRNALNLLLVCLSKTIYAVYKGVFDGSSTHLRKNLHIFSPKVLDKFEENVINTLQMMNDFNELNYISKCLALSCDSRNLALKNNSIDCIITSPPYGEEQNTIGYMRWTKFSLYWLGYTTDELVKFKKRTLGSKCSNIEFNDSKLLSEFIESLELPKRRIDHLKSFFLDYKLCLKEMFRTLKPDGHCCIVIGNRTIGKKPLDLDSLTVELAKNVNFEHITSFHRNIPTKSIPWTGISGKTIKKENIIILKKPEL